MRALLVDHDLGMLESVRRQIGSECGVTIEIAKSKIDCIERMSEAPCEILIACERLADGSGLELLSQIARRSPSTLRLFAAEPTRLALLLGGRLAPFRLYQTLTYPIEPATLLPLLVQMRAHALESVAPRPSPRVPRVAPPVPVRLRQPLQPPPAVIAPPPPKPAKRFGVDADQRRLLIGTVLLASAALVLLGVRLQSANSAAEVTSAAPVNWNTPAVASLVSEIELALTRGDGRRARAALQKLRGVAPTHPRIPFFERELLRESTVY